MKDFDYSKIVENMDDQDLHAEYRDQKYNIEVIMREFKDAQNSGDEEYMEQVENELDSVDEDFSIVEAELRRRHDDVIHENEVSFLRRLMGDETESEKADRLYNKLHNPKAYAKSDKIFQKYSEKLRKEEEKARARDEKILAKRKARAAREKEKGDEKKWWQL